MRVLIARASSRYSGRIRAELSLGDVVILIRDGDGEDGSLLLFSRAAGIPAKNWMPAGSTITESAGMIVAEHSGRGERLEIYIDSVEAELSAATELTGSLSKLDTEAAFADLLAARIELVDPGLAVIGREYRTAVGPIDILACERAGGRPVALELKRRRAAVPDIYQLRRYLSALAADRSLGRRRPRGILVAPRFARGTLAMIAEQPDMSFVRLGYEDCLD